MFDYNKPFSSFGGNLNGADVMRFIEEEKKAKLQKAAEYVKYYYYTEIEALLKVGLDINRLSRQDLDFFEKEVK